MQISFSIFRVHHHIDILRAEKREAEALVEYLHKLRTECAIDGSDRDALDTHFETAEKIVEAITRRISLLEFFEDTFQNLVDSTERTLLDAKDSVKISD